MKGASQAEKVAAYRAGADAIAAKHGAEVWSAKSFTDTAGNIIFTGGNAANPLAAPVLVISESGAVFKGIWGEIIRTDGKGGLWANLFKATKISE